MLDRFVVSAPAAAPFPPSAVPSDRVEQGGSLDGAGAAADIDPMRFRRCLYRFRVGRSG